MNSMMLLCHKAALGAGVGHGAAEDLGSAAAWLALRGFPVLDTVARAVSAVDSGASVYGDFKVGKSRVEWRPGSEHRQLSAAMIGGAASDLFALLPAQADSEIRMFDVDAPLLQLAQFSLGHSGSALRIRWFDRHSRFEGVVVDGCLQVPTEDGSPYSGGGFDFEVQFRRVAGRDSPEPSPARAEDRNLYMTGLDFDEEKWRSLQPYADRTLVEPTARSRELGAGAGTSDND